MREAYRRQPDAATDVDDWSNAEDWKQYEICWAELPGPAGRRPVLLLNRNDAYDVLNKFIAAEITTTIRHTPVELS